MEQKLNSLTISFAFLISIILHLFIFLSLGNFTFKLSDQLKNKITISLSAIGNIETNVIKKSIQKENKNTRGKNSPFERNRYCSLNRKKFQ